jgi:hypothetical protein
MSIDNFIDSHRDNNLISICGKLAISLCVLEAESNSKLMIDTNNFYSKINFKLIENTWFNSFFQLIHENCNKEELPERLKSISIISFNYDRCIEHYLYNSLQNYYGISADEAAKMLALLDIHHPYGKVGTLPWMDRAHNICGIKFGGNPSARQLVEISNQLRTFTEGTDPSISDIQNIREAISYANKIVFLGFAFHPLNLDLLFSEVRLIPISAKLKVFATAIGISRSNAQKIEDDLNKYLNQSAHINLHSDLKCSELIQEYHRTFSFTKPINQ